MSRIGGLGRLADEVAAAAPWSRRKGPRDASKNGNMSGHPSPQPHRVAHSKEPGPRVSGDRIVLFVSQIGAIAAALIVGPLRGENPAVAESADRQPDMSGHYLERGPVLRAT